MVLHWLRSSFSLVSCFVLVCGKRTGTTLKDGMMLAS